MRAEIHALLWIAAIVSVAYAAARFADDPDVAVLAPMAAKIDAESEAVAVTAGVPKTSVAEASLGGRPLFPVVAPSEPTPAVTAPVVVQAPPPVLKGVIEHDGMLKAVFASAHDPSQYSVVANGEMVAGTEITAIESDSVTARLPDGSVVTMKLRGTGELL
jgi:hypothetical protein